MADADFKLSQIGVVMLGVKDLAKSLAFYRDTLGLAVTGEVPGEFAFLNAGSVTLGLSKLMAPREGQQPGAAEIVFSVADVTAAFQALKAKGVPFSREPRQATGPMWVANFNDPDGHHLSVFGPKTAN
jgi:catechol 2,3-dioxygenase-like lactoylglutathione lyase family enzyme